VLVDDDARARVPPELTYLDSAAAGRDVEAAVVPAVPDRRQENGAVGAVRREDRDERLVEQIAEILRLQVLADASDATSCRVRSGAAR
jgi:hypothetical protein